MPFSRRSDVGPEPATPRWGKRTTFGRNGALDQFVHKSSIAHHIPSKPLLLARNVDTSKPRWPCSKKTLGTRRSAIRLRLLIITRPRAHYAPTTLNPRHKVTASMPKAARGRQQSPTSLPYAGQTERAASC
jgi:hypothetical protein